MSDEPGRPPLRLAGAGEIGDDATLPRPSSVQRGRYYLTPGWPNGVPIFTADRPDGSQLF